MLYVMMRRVVHFVISNDFLLSKYMMTSLFIDSLIPTILFLYVDPLDIVVGVCSLKTARPVLFSLFLHIQRKNFETMTMTMAGVW